MFKLVKALVQQGPSVKLRPIPDRVSNLTVSSRIIGPSQTAPEPVECEILSSKPVVAMPHFQRLRKPLARSSFVNLGHLHVPTSFSHFMVIMAFI